MAMRLWTGAQVIALVSALGPVGRPIEADQRVSVLLLTAEKTADYKLTDQANGVLFDIDGSGARVMCSIRCNS